MQIIVQALDDVVRVSYVVWPPEIYKKTDYEEMLHIVITFICYVELPSSHLVFRHSYIFSYWPPKYDTPFSHLVPKPTCSVENLGFYFLLRFSLKIYVLACRLAQKSQNLCSQLRT